MTRSADRRFFLLVFAAVLALRLITLLFADSPPAGEEERHQGVLALHLEYGTVLPLGAYRYEEYAGGTVLTGILAWPFFRLFGATLLALRLPGAILSALGAAFFALAYARVLGPVVGALAALCVAFLLPFPALQSVSAFGNHAELASFFGLWLFLFTGVVFLRGSSTHGLRQVALLGLLSGFLVFYDHLALFFAPAALLAWWSQKRRPAWSAGATFVGTFVVGFSPWFFTYGVQDLPRRLMNLALSPPGETPLRGFALPHLGVFFRGTLLASTGLPAAFGMAALLLVLGAAAALLVLNGLEFIPRRSGLPSKLPKGTPPVRAFEIFAAFCAPSYMLLLFLMRADSPPRYLLPLWPILAVMPILFFRRFRFGKALALVLPLLGAIGLFAHLRPALRDDLSSPGYSYRYFLDTYAAHYGIGARTQGLTQSAEGSDAAESELLYEGFILGHAALKGRDISRHMARLTGPSGRVPDLTAEGIVWAAIAMDRRYRQKIIKGETILALSAVGKPVLTQGEQSLRLRETKKGRLHSTSPSGEDVEKLKAILRDKEGPIKLLGLPGDFLPGERVHRMRGFGEAARDSDIPDIDAAYLGGAIGSEWDLIASCGRRVFDLRPVGLGGAFIARNLYFEDPGALVRPAGIKTDALPVLGGSVRLGGQSVEVASFRMDKLETTVADYTAFLNAIVEQGTGEDTIAGYIDLKATGQKIVTTQEGFRHYDGCENHPVVYVSYYGARAYCRNLGGDLPTTAEWVRAARGDDNRTYPWGNAPPDGTRANIHGAADGHAGLAPVTAYPAGDSPFGIRQMAGNVYEWTRPLSSRVDEAGDLRGGYWLGLEKELRIDHRESNNAGAMNNHDGFRCVYP